MIGHRGAPGYRPEHTRASYALALAQGVDAVEPDVVVSADGVLVVRHENEISGTTDVADRPEFAARRTTKTVDGQRVEGWFTEDFTWDELSTLRARERLPRLRPDSAAFDGREPVLRLRDVLDLVAGSGARGPGTRDAGGRDARTDSRDAGIVLEIKHATYFAALGWDVAALVADELHAAGWADGSHPLIIESFEQTVLGQVREHGIVARLVFLLEASGRPFDLVAARGSAAPTYAHLATRAGLDGLAGEVDGISVAKKMILAPDRLGRVSAPSALVADAHARGLSVFAWTCRPENTFLSRAFRGTGGKASFGDYAAEWGMLRDTGLDGVFVDHPDLGIRVFRDG